MKTKELFLLGFKSLKFLSLRKKIFLVIQIVIMLLILIPFGFYSVFSNAAETIINNQYEFREISLYGTSNDYEKYKSVLNEYENNHIVYIDELATPNIRAYTSVDSRNNFILKRKIEGFVPEVTNGNELNNKYDIICPEMATDANFEELNYNDLINLEEKIGKTINLNFLNSDDELVFSQEFNIVGTYNADFYYSYDTCYILNNTFDEILSKINSDLKEDSDTVKDLFILYVDNNENVEEILHDVQGVIVPGGFGKRGVEGKIRAIRYARENSIPYLGLCLGMQLSLIEYARDVLHLEDANSTEFEENCKNNIIDYLPDHLFSYCTSLTEFKGGENIKTLYKGVFEGTRVKSFTFSSLSEIDVDCFWNNQALESITILGDLDTLPGSCFERCTSLKSVNLSSSVSYIENYAFKNCSSLETFDFENIRHIENNAFESCAFTSLELNDTVLENQAADTFSHLPFPDRIN